MPDFNNGTNQNFRPEFFSPVQIVVELVVTAECDQRSKANGVGEEHLSSCIEPDLETIQSVQLESRTWLHVPLYAPAEST